jgi:very-short-patch-repair endonuclease
MPPKNTTPKMMHRAGDLRQNQTEAEAKLWSRLRAHRMAGVQFRRQHAIGNYIVDFSQRDAVQCSPRRKLIIELDGSQHLDQAEYDLERTQYLEAQGYRVLRFWNNDVMNDIEIVLNTIWNEINKVP